MRPPPRLALAFALALTPDNRPATRRAVLRGAALVNRNADSPLSIPQQRRVLKGFAGAQRIFVAFGVALYSLALRRLPSLLLFITALGWLLYGGIFALVHLRK